MVLSRNVRLFIGYGGDWLITIIFLGASYALDGVEGFRREFSLNDETIQFTFAEKEHVPPWLLYVLALAVPFVLMGVINLIRLRSIWDFHCSSLGLLLSFALTNAITQVIKITVGRPRPDFIDRCQPLAGSVNAPVFGLSNYSICTQTDKHKLEDGFKSFLSGHSSLSFSGLAFLSFYLAGKLHLFDHRGHQGKAWLSLLPLLGAGYVAISRTEDNRHHWQDVLSGSILGLVIAYFAYRQYYPNLASELSHKPYSPRIPREKQKLAVELEERGIDPTDSNMELGHIRGGKMEMDPGSNRSLLHAHGERYRDSSDAPGISMGEAR